ncbi:MAG: putative DNA binding domain-containing protein [Bacteroidales bacterium]|nr:putative DNA binding domain-containing protein [Bacteroidales bacterium]
MNQFFVLDSKGYIKRREGIRLEFKQNFQLGDNLIKYIKTLVGMANNRGGCIIFGIQDCPHIPNGMTNNKFSETDPKIIDKTIREYFSQELIWQSDTHCIDDKFFGILNIEEAENKPIICTKNKDKFLREGAIYYRYSGETKEIEYSELKNIIDKEREKEKILWMQHIKQIAMLGPKNVHLLDTYKGEISVGTGKILIDKNVIDKINFIREGKFVEKEGTPVLRLVGEITDIVDSEKFIPTDQLYPLLTKDLQDRLGVNSYDILCVLWQLKIKGDSKYHTEIKLGKKSNCVNKYSESLVLYIKKIINKDPDFINKCRLEYKTKNNSLR